jgi:hypothetical protein
MNFKEVRSQASMSCGKGHKPQHRFITITFAI